MPVYRERLGVPARWWLFAAALVLPLGTMVWDVGAPFLAKLLGISAGAGLSLAVAAGVYGVSGAVTAALLLTWGATTIEVAEGEIRAGRERLALREAGEVAAMSAAQTRALRGPRSDPAAYLLVRPYLPEAVYVEMPGGPRPYWLLGTRRPAELAAAIARARPAAGPPWEDARQDAELRGTDAR